MTLGALILSLTSSYPPRRRNSSSTSSIKDSRVTRGSWETTCWPALKDHDSRQPERKRRFLLATLVTKSFTFCFWLLWRDNFAKHLLINRSHEPDTPTKFLACYFRRELFFGLSTHQYSWGGGNIWESQNYPLHASCLPVLSSFRSAWAWLMMTPFLGELCNVLGN